MIPKHKITRPNLLKILSNNPIVEITFIKSTTKTIRVMLCTLLSSEIPNNYQKTLASVFTTVSNPDILPVWDTVKGKWRSFHISNILTVDEDIYQPEKDKEK